MATIPKKVSERLVAGIKRFQPILTASKARDDGEADTAMIVTEMLDQVFGYDKFSEITAEYAIKSTYCKRPCRGSSARVGREQRIESRHIDAHHSPENNRKAGCHPPYSRSQLRRGHIFEVHLRQMIKRGQVHFLE